ncbi:MAG: AAA family ATPase [Gammaproteobacteria bacterium]|nr:AAA family ATPase [Gammaproteobacteria bacterium]
MTRRQLLIDIQDFRAIREQDFYYVDKTSHVRQLVNRERYCFLSQPRRCGKSFSVNTVRELFEGNEPPEPGVRYHPPSNASGCRNAFYHEPKLSGGPET